MAINKDKIYEVKNRSSSVVVYTIPEDGIRREFAPGEVKRITYAELEKLTYQTGGKVVLNSYLQVSSPEVQDELNIVVEPEYNYSEAEIIDLIQNGSLDQFLDCLDFAPVGVLDLLKDLSTKVPLTDYEKRKALKDKTGFDVDKAISNIEAEKADDGSGGFQEIGKERRVKPAASTTPGRRTAGKYNIVTPKE